MSTVVVVAMGPALAEARLRSGRRMALAALNYARSYAAARQTYTMVALDRERGAVGVRARVRDIEGNERMAAGADAVRRDAAASACGPAPAHRETDGPGAGRFRRVHAAGAVG